MTLRSTLTRTAGPLLLIGAIGPFGVLSAASPAAAASSSPSAADSYGVLVAARLLQGNVPVNVGPLAEASQQNPPGGQSTGTLVQVPAIPADGSLVQNIGAIQTTASADGTPKSVATAQAANVKLLPTAGVPTVSADLIRAVSTTTCGAAPSAAGTQFVNLKVGPVVVPVNPPANTTIALGAVTVIVNEQHPTADGRGLVVNAIHIIAPGSLGGTPFPTAPVLQGDIIVSHAVSTVVCLDDAGKPIAGQGSTATPASTPILLHKTASPDPVPAGGAVTYSATVTNRSATSPCLVNELIDHLPVGFTPLSTDGPFGTKQSTNTRPDKGIDVVVVPATSLTIGPGATSAVQHFLVNASTVPGTYANNLELLCSDLGDFVFTGAPVTVTAAPAAPAGPANNTTPAGSGPAPTPADNGSATTATLPHTGGPGPLVPLSGAAVLTAAVALTARRRFSSGRIADES